MKTKRIFIFIALVLALGGVILLLLFPREPRYQGRPLSSWLQQCYDTPLDETQRLSEAQTAVRAMLIKKVLPRLLNLVEAKDDPVSVWMMDKSAKFRVQFLKWHSAEDFQQLGIAGFEVLGTNAAPVIEELAKLLYEKDHIFTTERCLVFVGKPAEPIICRTLTNQDSSIRQPDTPSGFVNCRRDYTAPLVLSMSHRPGCPPISTLTSQTEQLRLVRQSRSISASF